MFKRLSLLFVGLAMTAACSARPADNASTPAYTEGTQYVATGAPQRLDPKNGKVEVVEVFSYGCIHCAHYEPKAEQLQKELPKGVVFHAIPAAFNDAWLPYAQAYYAAKKLNALPATHAALFKAIHEEHYPLRTLDELADWYAQHGVDKAKFLAAANSGETRDRILADTKLIQAWGIDGTPTIVVDGKYRSAQIKDFDELNGVATFLVDKELKGGK
ncbi:thiol:disulfide interchange protein DsbA/DsbL [Luteibacter sp. E-22]|uniref:thiol:disulfide interchange protein DsbA/DsbL n=1 Tax=Luteibacter sp. E-22 TaxID=3404050 RepID=UPI003CF7DAB3